MILDSEAGAMDIEIKRLSDEIEYPRYAYPGDAGLDLKSSTIHTLKPGERALIPTGIAIAIPDGYAGLIIPRSGLALKHGIGVVNAPGLIDSHYRGEIKIILINHDLTEEYEIKLGDRIAQLVILPVAKVNLVETEELDETIRNTGGFGSSGR